MRTLKDAIYGLAVGDALGVPFEFSKRGRFECTDMIGYLIHGQPAGTWSDDTSMTLATCMSIKNKKSVDCNNIRKEFEHWYYRAEYTPFQNVFDCGITCSRAITNRHGCDEENSNGNGSLMRILPLAFTDCSDNIVADVSAITHAHYISKEGCIIYVNIARDLLKGAPIKESLASRIEDYSIYSDAKNIWNYEEDEIVSSGYIVDSFKAAMWCIATTDNYKDCVLKAVNLGGDTDTIAAIAGGLAGIIYGYNNIPTEWIDKLQAKDIIDSCLF